MTKVKKIVLSVLSIILLGSTTIASEGSDDINFPDGNLKKALIEEGVDINKDNEISLSEALEVKTLTLASKSINDLKGIEYFENLENLTLDDNKLKDLIPLRDLSKLTALSLKKCHIYIPLPLRDKSVLYPLNDLTNLKSLILDNTNIRQLSYMNIKSLTHLSLEHCNSIGSFSALQNFENLEYLSLFDCRDFGKIKNKLSVDKTKYLENLTKLKKLNLSGTYVQNLDYILNLKNLEYLNLSGNKTNYEGQLEKFENLNIHIKGYNIILTSYY